MKTESILLPIGSLLEFAGLATLLTNTGTFLPSIDVSFQVPVLLLSANIQGIILFLLGICLTTYSVLKMADKV